MKIVSGGQTGVDMAALDFAHENDLTYGGWVPRGRRNEAGLIPDHLTGLVETATEKVAERTQRNAIDSDATLIFQSGSASPGTQLTVTFAQEAGKPYLIVDLRDGPEACARRIKAWLLDNTIDVLNIAGPRASEAPGIGVKVRATLAKILDQLRETSI
ncbi:putative molybdenum carrier protein [Ruegeria sp.]|uniref:putative molybdenum carrier protein n=1 Tax=Ruegeria sp. TaxID=1879320 RepID=UPI003B5C812A